MKFAVGIISLTILSLQLIHAADVEYSVVAFPGDKQSVSVIVEGQKYPLSQSAESPNIFKGVAPSANEYQYALTGGSGDIIETALRKQQAGITTTGNEFFNRSQTVHDVPPLPQAYNPIHYSLVSNMNRSNEIATIILNVNATGFGDILKNPQAKHDYTNVFNMTYISNKEIYTFTNAGIKTSGQSSKDFAKQSYKIKLNEFATEGTKELLYGRTTFKLRAHETDPTFVREKLAIDCLAAAGAATVEGNFVRLYVNNEPYGLYLMIDDATKNFINNILRGGNLDYQYTGPTYKGNAMNEQLEGNLVYKDDLQESYNDTIYKLEDAGNMKKTLNKTNEKTPLIEFIKELNSIDPTKATDADNRGNIENLLDPQHTMIHMAINFLIGSWDGFWHQASNYYLTKETSSEKWTLISYDFDETFGLGAPRYMATTPYTNFSRPNSQRPLIDVFLKSPYYKGEFEKTLQTIVKRFFKPSVINPRLAAWKQMLQEDVEWDMSIEDKSEGIRPQWTIWNFANNMNTTDGESMGVSEWVQIRSLAVQEQLNFTDIDDVTPLEAYHNSNIWDPNNYEKEPINDKKTDVNKKNDNVVESSATTSNFISITTTLTLVACAIGLVL